MISRRKGESSNTGSERGGGCYENVILPTIDVPSPNVMLSPQCLPADSLVWAGGRNTVLDRDPPSLFTNSSARFHLWVPKQPGTRNRVEGREPLCPNPWSDPVYQQTLVMILWMRIISFYTILATFAPVVAREFYLFKSRIVLFYYVQVFKKNIELADWAATC